MTEMPDLSNEDVDVIHSLLNDPDLDWHLGRLEDTGALAEIAWFEDIENLLLMRIEVCKAIAVASARGHLSSVKITVPDE